MDKLWKGEKENFKCNLLESLEYFSIFQTSFWFAFNKGWSRKVIMQLLFHLFNNYEDKLLKNSPRLSVPISFIYFFNLIKVCVKQCVKHFSILRASFMPTHRAMRNKTPGWQKIPSALTLFSPVVNAPSFNFIRYKLSRVYWSITTRSISRRILFFLFLVSLIDWRLLEWKLCSSKSWRRH